MLLIDRYFSLFPSVLTGRGFIFEKGLRKLKTKPKIEIDIAEVEKLAGRGLSYEQICLCLGICDKTLLRKRRESSDLSDAIERGRAKGVKDITNALFDKAMTGDVRACELFLKCRCGWTDKQQVDVTSSDGSFSVASIIQAVELRRKQDEERREQEEQQ